MYLITGAGGGVGSVSRHVVRMLRDEGAVVRAMVHREDDRADLCREFGADVVIGDLTNPQDVVNALRGASRVFFNLSVSLEYLRATAVLCAAAREECGVELIVNMSEIGVSQMTLTSSEESRQQRLHWLSEQIMNWSRVPVAHVRPTAFLDDPLFTTLPRRSVRERGVLPLPFGQGRTSPIAAEDVANVVTTLLNDPAGRAGRVYELTGPEALDIHGLAEQWSRGLGRRVAGEDVPHDDWVRLYLRLAGLPEHTQQHLSTMARLHREGRYELVSNDVESVTGRPARTVAEFVAARPELFA